MRVELYHFRDSFKRIKLSIKTDLMNFTSIQILKVMQYAKKVRINHY